MFDQQKSELLALLKSFTAFPELIIITKVNPKCMALGLETSEFNINGYNIYSSNVDKCNKRGIIIYINCKLSSTEIALVSVFSEYLFVQIKGISTQTITVGAIYRSPSSTAENDNYLFNLINEMKSRVKMVI